MAEQFLPPNEYAVRASKLLDAVAEGASTYSERIHVAEIYTRLAGHTSTSQARAELAGAINRLGAAVEKLAEIAEAEEDAVRPH